uniref:Uncharacterized protein n=1 Tax=Anguilla anguilla TaxID=7936 RepID=A0A0E9QT38_ANGAN
MGSVDPHAACPTESGTRRFLREEIVVYYFVQV